MKVHADAPVGPKGRLTMVLRVEAIAEVALARTAEELNALIGRFSVS